MGQRRPQVGEEGRFGPDTGEFVQVDIDGNEAVLEEGSPRQQRPVRAPRRRAAGEELAALGSRKLRQQDEDTVLGGGARRDCVPLLQVARTPRG